MLKTLYVGAVAADRPMIEDECRKWKDTVESVVRNTMKIPHRFQGMQRKR